MATFLDVTALESFSIIFVFLLVWVGSYAILLYTKVLGQNQFVSIIISLVIAFLTIISPLATLIVKSILPFVAVALLLIIVVSSASGMLGKFDADALPGLKGILIVILVYSTDINPARANKATLNTIRALYNGQKADDLYSKMMSIPSPHVDDIRNDYARAANTVMMELLNKNQPQQAMDFFQPGYDELKKNRILHPMDIRVHLQQAQMAQLGAQIKQDYSLLAEAESDLEEALKESPKRQQVQFMLASIKLQLNKPAEAIKISEDALNNDPKVGESWWRLAMAYGYSGDKQKALEIIDEGKKTGLTFSDPQAVNFINSLSAK